MACMWMDGWMDGARIFKATQSALRFVLRDHVSGNYSAAGTPLKSMVGRMCFGYLSIPSGGLVWT